MAEVYEDVDEAITDLPGSPTTDQVVLGTRDFSARELAASATRRALAGGGGGGGAAEDITVNSGTLVGTGTDVQAVLEELDNGIADHLADGSAAHAASAVSVNSATLVGTGTDVQAVLEELDDAIAGLGGGGGADLYDPLGWGVATNTMDWSNAVGVFGTWAVANYAFFWRVKNGKQGATKIRLGVVTQSGNLSFALYQTSGSGATQVPGTLIAATGAIACPAVGTREIALGSSYNVLPGSWLAMSCDNNTASFIRTFNGVDTSGPWEGLGGYIAAGHTLSGSSPTLDGYALAGGALLIIA